MPDQLKGRSARVVVGYLKNASRADEVVATITDAGGTASAIQADLSHPAEVGRLFDEAEQAIGVFFTLQQAARRINDKGRIIVSSTGGTRMFFPNQSLYLGSKGAVEQFVRALAAELGERDITVNAISPGPTDTDMMQDQYRDTIATMSPFHRIGTPDDVADVAVFLASDAARWITGQNIGAGGGVF
jgi:3-oxoacyl-[acyl-carrier protein] reductase